MRRLAGVLIGPMRVPVPADPEALFDALVDSVSRWRGREVVVRREAFPPHTASGLWLEADTQDVVVVDKRAAVWHQIVIFCHEVWHMNQQDPDARQYSAPVLPGRRRAHRLHPGRRAGGRPLRHADGQPAAALVEAPADPDPGVRRVRPGHRRAHRRRAQLPGDPEMNGLINYVSCGALWLGLVVKAPDLVRHRHDPFLRVDLRRPGARPGLCFFLGAEPTVAAVNQPQRHPQPRRPADLRGDHRVQRRLPGADRLLAGRPRRAPHRPLRGSWPTRFVLLGIAVTFSPSVTRRWNAAPTGHLLRQTPFIAEMIVLYLAGHLAAVSVTSVSALRWAREVRGWLRAGLWSWASGAVSTPDTACPSSPRLRPAGPDATGRGSVRPSRRPPPVWPP